MRESPQDLNRAHQGQVVVPSYLSHTIRRRIFKRLCMQRKRAEASGGTAQPDPARLKPVRKVSATSKYRQLTPHGDSDLRG